VKAQKKAKGWKGSASPSDVKCHTAERNPTKFTWHLAVVFKEGEEQEGISVRRCASPGNASEGLFQNHYFFLLSVR